MKKRLIALLIIVALLTTLVFTCFACSTGMFEKDEERDYYQVIATVRYGELSKDIYKGQLATYVNSYGSQYINNYGMTVAGVVEYFYNTLTKSALLSLYAKYYVYEKATAGDPDFAYVDTTKAITALEEKDFVSLSQRVYAIDQTNSDFMSSYESILSDLTKKEDDEEETVESPLTPRTVRTIDEDRSEYKADLYSTSIAAIYGREYEKTTYGQITPEFIASLGETDVDTFLAKLDIFNVISEKIKLENNSTTKKNMKSALKTLKENIEKSHTGYAWFLDDKYGSCILTSLRDGLKKAVTSTDADIEARYLKLINDNIANLDETSYSSAISGSTFMPVNAADTYAGVKSILLKFSDKQTAALNFMKVAYAATEDKLLELRDNMALGIADADVSKYLKDNTGIKVNISDPYYDANYDKAYTYKDGEEEVVISAGYTDIDVDYKVVLYLMAEQLPAIQKEIVDTFKASNEYAAMNDVKKAYAEQIVSYSAMVEAFTQWMYLVNDDSGMFSSEAYTITPDGKDTTYVEEYTVLARRLATQALASYVATPVAATTDVIVGAEVKYTSKFNSTYNVDGTLTIVKEPATSTTTAADPLKAQIYTATTNNGNSISFIINDYGIHIVLVTEKYGCANFATDSVSAYAKGDKNGFVYTYNKDDKSKDAIYDRDTSIKYEFAYAKVAEDATYSDTTKYYTWDGDSYERIIFKSAEEFTPATKTYYVITSRDVTRVTCDYQTLYEYLDDASVTALFTTKYSADQIALYLGNLDGKSASISKVDKVYDELLKAYES